MRTNPMLKRAAVFICMFAFSCTQKMHVLPPDPIPVHDNITLHSEIMSEDRPINIWLPPQYHSTKDSFAVLYMLDGGLQEDFPHVAHTISGLIETGKIKPIILVGIQNTQRRRDLTGPTQVEADKKIAAVVGGSARFRKFIETELFAAIQKYYRTKTQRAIIGESLAGLFVMETFLLKPELFHQYIAFDPSLWWNNQYTLQQLCNNLNKPLHHPTSLWFAASGTEDIYQSSNRLNDALQQSKHPALHWKYVSAPKEKHSTIFRATKEEALLFSFGNP